jgi:hypothetical protein
MQKYLFILFTFSINLLILSQNLDSLKNALDAQYILEIEEKTSVYKVLHAEPLYIDLIRDLGARKGEKEWNFGAGMFDNTNYDRYEALVEYEFAPINRLGFEVEMPFSFYYPHRNSLKKDSVPNNKLESIKLATQWTFLVSQKFKTSMALGYIHEFEITDFNKYRNSSFFTGNVFNPFFVAAKRWGDNFHTLIYTGPRIEKHFNSNKVNSTFCFNSNFHYMIPGTRNFIGIEINKEFNGDDFDMTIRPQLRIEITQNLLIGIITGIPVYRESQRLSSFFRVIYEPNERKSKHQFTH